MPQPDPGARDGGMTEEALELDTRGLLCPLPVLKLRKAMKPLPAGAAVRLLADDPAARIDVPHFCHEQGHAYDGETEREDGSVEYRLRKGP